MGNRWVREIKKLADGERQDLGAGLPPIPSLEVVYLTDPEALAAVLPPPLTPPAEPRVHVRITDIDLTFGEYRHKELVGFLAVDAVYDGFTGEYPLLIPIDLESAISVSRERNGEPKKLADIELIRAGDHVEGRITRNGVTFVEIVGDVAGPLPVGEPYPAAQWWYKFMPAVSGSGFDGDPLLVRYDQVRTPVTAESVEGKLVLRDEPTAPIVDLPVRETASIAWTTRSSKGKASVVGPVDPVAFEPFAYSRYDH
ncbi:acetoacetate decarboxylase family protein [Frankia sp. CNm7]|uniref:Acetoacetate decarboxylase family protein n=2 Tax=Frankia nepalensis TaxID=1836974 RepID=A0A937UNX1_9ACTN|nr:acetoacetate decarboxylase family protein [Frankia nepalensis]MBL7500024.1 acetoacetate decarboxylase family protein [Frankia nepalensis]MBL7511547.1 acetoacetate decarboxylase family protein [Frankia nepalensis]MBL7521011.1 acetoacetate decarboxylase family protein [Frankia nepalensis]MBL7628513.1 acetoacetate decarboxylase family protein [Frankia nepalensis]